MKQKLAIAPLLLLIALQFGCPGSTPVNPPDPLQNLQTVAKALNDISIASNAAVKGIIIVMPNNTPERSQALAIISRVIEANQRGRAIVRQLVILSPNDAQSLSAILDPVFVQFRQAVDSGLLGFKNLDTKNQVQGYINGISAAIDIIEAILKCRVSADILLYRDPGHIFGTPSHLSLSSTCYLRCIRDPLHTWFSVCLPQTYVVSSHSPDISLIYHGDKVYTHDVRLEHRYFLV